jgi:hypothetical protein
MNNVLEAIPAGLTLETLIKPIDSTPERYPHEDDFEHLRRITRARLIKDAILGREVDVEPMADFYGSGDSGQLGDIPADADVAELFDDALRKFVTFDWYNNEGGGGDITWNVLSDVITINGYYNVVEQVHEMSEAEF